MKTWLLCLKHRLDRISTVICVPLNVSTNFLPSCFHKHQIKESMHIAKMTISSMIFFSISLDCRTAIKFDSCCFTLRNSQDNPDCHVDGCLKGCLRCRKLLLVSFLEASCTVITRKHEHFEADGQLQLCLCQMLSPMHMRASTASPALRACTVSSQQPARSEILLLHRSE